MKARYASLRVVVYDGGRDRSAKSIEYTLWIWWRTNRDSVNIMRDQMELDPAFTANDMDFIEFVSTCEQLRVQLVDPIEIRDAIAAEASELAQRWTMPDPDFRKLQPGAPYSSYQLYLNQEQSLSMVIDIFAPGQVAPIHNHCCWGVFVCLDGEELERQYRVAEDLSGRPTETAVRRNGPGVASVGDPARNAFHQVECVGDVAATSLHIYGANIKALDRDRWDEETGRFVSFKSGADPRRRQACHYLTPAGLKAHGNLA